MTLSTFQKCAQLRTDRNHPLITRLGPPTFLRADVNHICLQIDIVPGQPLSLTDTEAGFRQQQESGVMRRSSGGQDLLDLGLIKIGLRFRLRLFEP